MKGEPIKTEEINAFLNKFNDINFPEIRLIKEHAEKYEIPLLDDISAGFLYMSALTAKPKSILEIGFGSGYSTFWLKKACPNAHITSIERDPTRFKKGKELFKNLNISINLLNKDARVYLESECDLQFDYVFIDAVKAQYLNYLKRLEEHLTNEAVIISDNIFMRGFMFKDLYTRKKEKEVQRVVDYCEYLKTNPAYQTVFLPIGDGIAYSYYKAGF